MIAHLKHDECLFIKIAERPEFFVDLKLVDFFVLGFSYLKIYGVGII
jgi:hypothetical protein